MSISALFQLVHSNISIIMILIFAGIPLLIGSAAATKSVSTVSDFFLCNRSLGTASAFFTIYATWWSSFAFLGSTSSFYSHGPVYWIALGWNVLFSLIFLGLGRQLWRQSNLHNFKTPIDFFMHKYHSRPLNNMVILIMIALSIPYIEVQFIGGGIIIEMATNGAIPWKVSTLLFFAVMIIYLWSGGLRAVAWADAFYAILIFSGMLLIGILFVSMTGGISATFQALAEKSPQSLKIPAEVNGMNGYGFWVSLLIIMPLGEIMMPQIWTRTYAIKEERTFYLMPFLLSAATLAYVGTMLAGNAAILLAPSEIASSDYILPILLVKYISPPVMAFIMCCVVAACLSTVNSQLHSMSLLVSLNIYKPYFNKKATEKHMVHIAKLVIVFFAALAYLLLLYTPLTSIVETVFPSFCGMMQLIVPVVGGLYWKKATAAGAISGLSVGVALALIFSLWQPFTYFISPGIVGLVVNGLVFIVVSNLTFDVSPSDKGGAYEKTV